MDAITKIEPIDYLVIGHISCDITKHGRSIGGTASYAALTAKSIGLRVGIVTSWGNELPLGKLANISIINQQTKHSTTFENLDINSGRRQVIHNLSSPLTEESIPRAWTNTPIVHFGPIAQEISPSLVTMFPNSFIGITPQGWLRSWDTQGEIKPTQWKEANQVVPLADAIILSREDIGWKEEIIEEMSGLCPVFVVTEGYLGARVYWHGDVRHFNAPKVIEIDATGAGDIFAASFFIRYHKTRNPWESARFANILAARSVTRFGLDSTPTIQEGSEANFEVF